MRNVKLKKIDPFIVAGILGSILLLFVPLSCGTRLDAGDGTTLLIDSYGKHGAVLKEGGVNLFYYKGPERRSFTWRELRRMFPHLKKEFDRMEEEHRND